MQKFSAFFVFGLILFLVGCQSSADNTKMYVPWCAEDAANLKARWGDYSNILMVCIYEDRWEDGGPHRLSLSHQTGTVVKVYKGDWRVSERISFGQGFDYSAPSATNRAAGNLGFVFTNSHDTNSEIGLDTGDYWGYDPDLEPALDYFYPQKNSR